MTSPTLDQCSNIATSVIIKFETRNDAEANLRILVLRQYLQKTIEGETIKSETCRIRHTKYNTTSPDESGKQKPASLKYESSL